MVAFIPSLPEMEAFLYKNNNFYVFQTDIVSTYGLTFSQIGIRLCPVQEEELEFRVGKPLSTLNITQLGMVSTL